MICYAIPAVFWATVFKRGRQMKYMAYKTRILNITYRIIMVVIS